MAKKKEELKRKEEPKVDKMVELIKKIKSKSKYGKKIRTLESSKDEYSPDDYFDTGNIMLNLLTSGDWHKGMPSNISIQLLGDSDTGKSLFGKIITFGAYKKGYIPTIIESEGAIMYDSLVSMGFNPNHVLLLEADHVKEAGSMIQETIETLTRKDKQVFLFDSIGNMPSSEEFEKRKKSDASPTVGKKAIETNSMFRNLKKIAFLKNKPLIFVNREYANMDNSKYTAEENKRQSTGGSGNDYAPSVTLRFVKKYLKKKVDYRDEENTKKSKSVVYGMELTVIAKKSRNVWSNSYIKIRILNDSGLQRYSGLYTELSQSPYYKYEGEKNGTREIYIKDKKDLKLLKVIKNESDITHSDWMGILNGGFGDWLNNKFELPQDDYSKFFEE